MAALTTAPGPALVLAATQTTLAAAAFTGSKVEGLPLLKLLGVLAPAMWWLRLLPPYRAVDVLRQPTVPGAPAGMVVRVLTGALLLRRTVNRLSRQ